MLSLDDVVGSCIQRPPLDVVVPLTADNFTEFVSGQRVTMVQFYTTPLSHCLECTRLEPHYQKAARKLQQAASPPSSVKTETIGEGTVETVHTAAPQDGNDDGTATLLIAKVDCTAEAELCKTWAVTEHPTLKIFRKGVYGDDLSGKEMSAAAIVQVMEDELVPAATELGLASEIDALMSMNQLVVVGWFDADDRASIESFQDLAASLRRTHKLHFTTHTHAIDRFARSDGARVGGITTFLPRWYVTEHDKRRSTTWTMPPSTSSSPSASESGSDGTSTSTRASNSAAEYVAAASKFIASTTYPLVGKLSLSMNAQQEGPHPYAYEMPNLVALFADLPFDPTFRDDSRKQIANIAVRPFLNQGASCTQCFFCYHFCHFE